MLKYANKKIINPKNQANNNFIKSSATRYNDWLGATLLTCCQSLTISCVRLYRTGPIGPGCTPAQFYSGPACSERGTLSDLPTTLCSTYIVVFGIICLESCFLKILKIGIELYFPIIYFVCLRSHQSGQCSLNILNVICLSMCPCL